MVGVSIETANNSVAFILLIMILRKKALQHTLQDPAFLVAVGELPVLQITT